MRCRIVTLVSAGLAGALMLSACGDGGGSRTVSSGSKSPTATQAPAVVTAPASARIDLAEPSFSNPIEITNPRFPISDLTQVIQLGAEAGAALRFEVTLLPETKVIVWNGKQIETRVSQFVAYENGRLLEVAVDFFAQADDGSVWYFGEDVANYVGGVIANVDGTWLAGKHGPPGMIMPGDPQVGDVYRPENIPGFVFEEVTVKAVGETLPGPRGAVDGAIVVQEKLMDGLLEDKTFAPGYGEFHFAVKAEKELVDLALAVPTDVLPGPVPADLATVSTGADELFEQAPEKAWDAIKATSDSMTIAWDKHRAGDVPELVATQMDVALDALGSAIDGKDPSAVMQAALDVGDASTDLELQFRTPADVDLDRLDLWARQVLVDAAAGEDALVSGDVVILETIRDRVVHAAEAAIRAQIEASVAALRVAADAGDLDAATESAEALRAALA